MKFPPGQTLVPRRGASLRGIGIWKENKRYGQVFQKHPKRQPAVSEAERLNRETLGAAARIAGVMSAEQQQLSREIAAISQLAERDFLIIQLFTRAFYIIMPNGKRVYSMASLQDTSQLLDVLSQTPGSLLFKGPDWWTGLLIGTPGQVLTAGAGGLPEWAAGASGGGPPDRFLSPPYLNCFNGGNFNRDNPAFLGIVPTQNQALTGLKVMCKAANTGCVLVSSIYQADASGNLSGGTLLSQSAAIQTAVGLMTLPFAAPVNVTAGQSYWIGLLSHGGSANPQFMTTQNGENSLFFGWSSTTMPASPSSQTATGAAPQFTWWAY